MVTDYSTMRSAKKVSKPRETNVDMACVHIKLSDSVQSQDFMHRDLIRRQLQVYRINGIKLTGENTRMGRIGLSDRFTRCELEVWWLETKGG